MPTCVLLGFLLWLVEGSHCLMKLDRVALWSRLGSNSWLHFGYVFQDLNESY